MRNKEKKRRKIGGFSKVGSIEARWGYFFLLPNIIGFLTFTLIPVVVSLFLSLCRYDILTPARFIGLLNYSRLLKDSYNLNALKNTVYYTVGVIPPGMIISLFLAILVNQKLKEIVLYRALFFLPVITSTVAVSIVWAWLYDPVNGYINYILRWFGIDGPNWLGSTTWAMPAIIIMSVWKGLGFNMVIYLAALQGIPEQLYEAARIDGAGWWAQFRHITLPMVSPTTFFVLIMSVIGSFQVFDQAYIMTRGGPAEATVTMVYQIYVNAFQYFRMGYASAIAWLLFFIILGASLFQIKFQKRWVFYG